jgi:hypothetical protein
MQKDSKSLISWWRLKPRTISRVSRKHATENNTQPPKAGRALLLLLRLVELGCIIGHLGDFVTLGFCTTAASASRFVGGHAWDAHELPFSPNGSRATTGTHSRGTELCIFYRSSATGIEAGCYKGHIIFYRILNEGRLVSVALAGTGDLHVHNRTHPSPIHILGSEVK